MENKSKQIKSYNKKLKSTVYQKLSTDFKTFIVSKNYKSITNYSTPVYEFLAYLELHKIKHVRKVNSQIMVQYYDYLSNRTNQRKYGILSEKSVKGHLYALALFFEYLLNAYIIDKCIILPKFNLCATKQRQTLTKEEVLELFKYCLTKFEKALLSVAYGCGLRRSELNKLNVQDIQFTRGVLIVVEGKNAKRREIPMSDGVIKYLSDYLNNERGLYLINNQKESAFFVNKIGNRMLGKDMNNMLKKIIIRTENFDVINKGITLHCLRHTLAEHLVSSGADIEFVKRVLGHTLIDTSFLYAVKNRNKKILSIH